MRWGMRTTLVVLVLGVVGLGAGWWTNTLRRPWESHASLQEALARRGRLAWVSPETAPPQSVSGTTFVAVKQTDPAGRALAEDASPEALAPALRALELRGLALRLPADHKWPASAALPDSPVLQRLRAYDSPPGLLASYLAKELALYELDAVARLPARYRSTLAEVARRMLAGERPPRFTSFPPLLRQVQHVEVMVLLRDGTRPRLWRSARGSSVARAFLTAVRVARQRWREREQAMGGALLDALPGLVVEVALLRDDGEIGERSADFIDQVVTPQHGIAYEHKGSWRYLLPGAVQRQGAGRPSRALEQLLEDNGFARDAYRRPEFRVTRLLRVPLAISPPQADADWDALRAPTPDEVLGLGR